MPNWCQNEVTVYADTKGILDQFRKFVKGDNEEFSFQSILPVPSELTGTCSPTRICTDDEYHEWIREHQPTYDFNNRPITKQMSERFKNKYGADNWYDWSVQNWGTKWEVGYVEYEQLDEQSIRYSFDTAWSPPEGIYDTLVDRFPDLEISWFYREEGMQFAGYLPN